MKFSKDAMKVLAKSVVKGVEKHSPEILTGIGIAGMFVSVVLAVKVTPKALEKINEDHPDGCTKAEAVKSAWKFYIPVAVSATCSTACIIGATTINLKRNAALAAAYTLSESFAKEYKESVLETIGEKKEAEVRENIAQKKVDKLTENDFKSCKNSNDDTTWFLDPYSGRPFKSSMNRLFKVQNEVNNMLLNESVVSLNDLYYMIGLDPNKDGDQLGWNNDKGLLNFNYTPVLSKELDEAGNRIAVIALDYNIEPRAMFL